MTRKELDTLWFQAMRQSIEDGEDFVRYHFATLVAAHEREACANVCEKMLGIFHPTEVITTRCAKAIRARGET